MTKKQWPKIKSKWVILSGFLLYVVADFVHGTLQIDLLNLTPDVAKVEWLIRVARDWALAVAIATMIITGIRRVRRDGFTLKRLILPALGICIATSWLWISYYGYRTFLTVPAMPNTPDAVRRKIEAHIKSQKDPEIKAKRSKFYAYMRFHEDGVLITYITPDGKVVPYSPTEKWGPRGRS